MRVGFSGTRKGMTPDQLEQVIKILEQLYEEDAWFDHGDCVGAYAQAHTIALNIGYRIRVHPPKLPIYRAFCEGATVVLSELPYDERNYYIVEYSTVMVAAPSSKIEAHRGSGTWQVIRLATRRGRPLSIVYPDGSVE